MVDIVLWVALCLSLGAPNAGRGVLVMAHGGDLPWNTAIEQVIAPLRELYPTEIALGMADTSTIRAAVQRLEAKGIREIAVVRMFISGESFVPETEYILGLRSDPPAGAAQAAHGSDGHEGHGGHAMAPPEPIRSNAKFFISRQGVAESPLLDHILAERVKALSEDPARESVLILAHGPGDDAENGRWLANMEQRVRRVRASGHFREVRTECLREDWPDKREQAERRIREFVEQGGRDGRRVIVVPFRIAGFGPYAEVLEGLNYVADQQGFCPHPNMTRWLAQTAEACFSAHGSP